MHILEPAIALIPLGSSRHVKRVETCCLTSSTQPKRMGSTRHISTRCVERVETSVSSRAVRQVKHSQNAWAVELVVSRRDEPSEIWAYLADVGLQDIFNDKGKHCRLLPPHCGNFNLSRSTALTVTPFDSRKYRSNEANLLKNVQVNEQGIHTPTGRTS